MSAEAVSNRGPSAYQSNALPLGQTGSQCVHYMLFLFIVFKKYCKPLLVGTCISVGQLSPSLPWCHLKTINRSRKFEIIKPFYVFFASAGERIFIKTHTTEIRFIIGPGNILFSGTFQPGNCTGCDSEGVN